MINKFQTAHNLKNILLGLSTIVIFVLFALFFQHKFFLLKLGYTLFPFIALFGVLITGIPTLLYFASTKSLKRTSKLLNLLFLILLLFTIAGVNTSGSIIRFSYAANTALILFTASCLGRRIFDLLKIKLDLPLSRITISTLFGFGLISLLFLTVGSLYQTGITTTWGIIIFCVLFAAPALSQQVADIKFTTVASHESATVKKLFIRSTLVLSFLLVLPCSFLPPMDYDVTEYHAELPQRYLHYGKIEFDKNNLFSGMPQNMEMLTLASFSLSTGKIPWITAKLIHWIFFPLLILLTIMIAGELGAGKDSWLATILLMSAPLSMFIATKLYVEIAMSCFGLASFYLFLCANKNKQKSIILIISGIFAGFAAGTKYPALLFFCLPITIMVAFNHRQKAISVKDALFFIGGILLSFSPWMLKNYFQTGNPFYPIFNNLFNVSGWDKVLQQRFHDAHHATDFSLEAIKTNLQNIFIFGKQLFPSSFIFSLLLIPLFVKTQISVNDNDKQNITTNKSLIIWICSIIVMWFYLTHRLERFLHPGYVIASIGGAVGIAKIKNKYLKGIFKILIMTLFTTSLVVFGWSIYIKDNAISKVILGKESPDSFLAKQSWYQQSQILKALPKNSKVLALGEAAHFYYPYNIKMTVVFGHNPLISVLKNANSVADIEDFIKKQGYTHIFISWFELARLHATYCQAYTITPNKQRLLRKFIVKNVTHIMPLSAWQDWNGEKENLPKFIKNDFAKYKKIFGIKSTSILPHSSYTMARPWIGAFGNNEQLTTSTRQLLKILKDYQLLLSPTINGGPPPLARAPLECLVLKRKISIGK